MATLLNFQSVVLIVAGAVVMAGMLAWASERLEGLQEGSSEASETLITCSELQVDFVDRTENETHHTVFFQVNRQVEALEVRFNGSSTTAKVLRDLEKNKIYSASSRMENVEEVDSYIRNCEEVTS